METAVDLLPTFCEVAGAPLPESLEPDGVSQVAVLKGKPAPVRAKPLFWKKQEARESDADFAILDRKWKLLTDVNFKKIQLYAISIDPLEKNDVAAAHSEVAAQLVEKLKAWIASLPEKANPELFSEKRGQKNQ